MTKVTKVAVFGPAHRVGIVVDDRVFDANFAYAKYLSETTDHADPLAYALALVPAELNSFIAEGMDAIERVNMAIEQLRQETEPIGLEGEQISFRLSEVKLHAPIAGQSRIFAALGNFLDHMNAASDNSGDDIKEVLDTLVSGGPKYFAKDPRTVSATEESIRYPRRTNLLDYEAEVAAVIGTQGRDIGRDTANSYIYGYTLFNDWSVRTDISFGPDFLYSKNFDTSATLGPWIVVGETIDPQDIPFESYMNGELRQSGNTKSMAHDFAKLIAHLSVDSTLWPGDLIASGTPKGTAVDQTQQLADGTIPGDRFPKPGDTVEITSSLLGTLRNQVSAATN